ncbi:hypothetical protein LZF95_14020 [Algoriphagus sp. AGSA1]|uniref:hypothetical protein n=1 Tax=Algoriphagus sp. AGSA1 TaxID=2907213 RepID=UPI001F2FAF34|nr:hypothetical protein [Algoriphagus sp. AGSA1]MCE7055793.1 hypothetical protein [Algoriphagus sp. AGSA1]
MKYLLTILIFVIGVKSFACKCAFNDPIRSFSTEEFVGHIKITQVYPNEGESSVYKTDVELLELFKGSEITSIFVGGRSDGKIGTSCDVFYPAGSELVVTASRNSSGQLVFGMCSFIIDLNAERRSNQINLDVIRTLSKWDNTYSSNLEYFISSEFADLLESKKGIQVKERFALFEVNFNDQQLPIEVNVIKGFEDPVDAEIVETLSNCTYKLRPFGADKSRSDSIKIVVPVYFYPAERGNKSFMGTFVL